MTEEDRVDEQFVVGQHVVARVAFEVTSTSNSEPEGRISLFPAPEYGGPIKVAVLYFRGPFFGDLPTSPVMTVRAILPPSEFDHWNRILRTEDPIYLKWEGKSDGTLRRLALSSAIDLPGEWVG
jgi:hypothetical protein